MICRVSPALGGHPSATAGSIYLIVATTTNFIVMVIQFLTPSVANQQLPWYLLRETIGTSSILWLLAFSFTSYKVTSRHPSIHNTNSISLFVPFPDILCAVEFSHKV